MTKVQGRITVATVAILAIVVALVSSTSGTGSTLAATNLAAAATSTKASCTQNPTVVLTPAAQPTAVRITEVCTVPLPPAPPTPPVQTVTVTASSSPTPSDTVTPTPTVTPSPTVSPTGTPTTGPANFPDSASTGPAGTLTPYTGGHLISADLSGVDITGSVDLAAGVTLSNSRIRCENESSWCVSMGAGSTLSHDEVGGGATGTANTTAIGIFAGSGGKTNLIDHVDVHNTSDGLRIDGNTTIRDSYIHDLVIAGHSDGAQITQGAGPILFDHDAITGGTNCAVFDNRNDGTSTSTLTVQNSLLVADQTGSNQSSYGVFDNRTTAAAITGNTFSRGWQVAPISITAGTASSNTYTDGTPIA